MTSRVEAGDGTAMNWRTWHGYAPLDASPWQQAAAASGDLVEGARRWRLWGYLALEVLKNQYRRTTIGPWWLTLQTLAYVIGLAVLFGAIFRIGQRDFLPYVACGFIAFALLTGLTRAASMVFVEGAGDITSTRQPLSVLVLRAASVELLVFAHNVVILFGLAALGYLTLGPASLLVAPALMLIVLNGLALGFWLGPLVARFRDLGPLVLSVLQMMMFFTPVFWDADSLTSSARQALLTLNPFYYLLDCFRSPLLGEAPWSSFAGACAVTAINVTAGALVFVRTRSHIPYWVS